MLSLFLLPLLAIASDGEMAAFAGRLAKALQDAGGCGSEHRVLWRIEARPGVEQGRERVHAVEESLRRNKLALVAEGETTCQLNVTLAQRLNHTLAVGRTVVDGKEVALVFADLPPASEVRPDVEGEMAVSLRTRTLLVSEDPILDVQADGKGNVFVLHTDRLRVYALVRDRLELKAELGVDTGAGRLRDALVRLLLVVQESSSTAAPAASPGPPPQLQVHSAAVSVAPGPPLPLEGYAVKTFGAAAALRVPHATRGIFALLYPVPGMNYFRGEAIPALQGLASLRIPLRAHWAVLDVSGRLMLADAQMRPMAAAEGDFGGDVAAVNLSCAGSLVLSAGPDPQPAQDRIRILRVDRDQWMPYTQVELSGAVRRLVALPPSPDAQGRSVIVLAVAEDQGHAYRLDAMEMSCPQ